MPMNLVIQEKRKALGLTQEQVAQYLNVSIPAVSKWETGTTSPDILLLAPLARLLKIDLNTLMCFHAELSAEEIGLFCAEIVKIVQSEGIEAGFSAAERKLQEYPRNETLLFHLTMQLDGLLAWAGRTEEELRPFEEKILSWYRRLAGSADAKISNSANYMLASRYIRSGNDEMAQETLDLMPDRNDLTAYMADKLMLQVEIDRHCGRLEEASERLQRELLKQLQKVQLLLWKMVDMELQSGDMTRANAIAVQSEKMVTLFDLWAYNAYLAPLQVALAEKDTQRCIPLLRGLLEQLQKPWDAKSTTLFNRLPWRSPLIGQMLPTVLSEMRGQPQYAFLQSSAEFQKLIAEYERIAQSHE